MPQQAYEFKSPLKGVMKQPTFSAANGEFAVDALNVLPHDRDDRLRIAQRSGTTKQYAGAIGKPSAVYALGMTTLAIDPAAAAPSLTLATADFSSLAQNAQVGAIGGSKATWYTVNGASAVPTGAQVDGAVTIGGATAPRTAGGAGAGTMSAAQYVPSLALGSSYAIRLIGAPGAGSASGVQQSIGIAWRVAPVASPDTSKGIYIRIWTDNWQMIDNTTSSVIASGALTGISANAATSPTTFEIRVNGNSFGFYVGGVLKGTGTSTNSATLGGVGFYVGNVCTYNSGVRSITFLTTSLNNRQNNLVAVAGGSIYVGDNSALSVATGGSGVITDGVRAQIAFGQNNAYIVDGYVLHKLVLSTSTTAAMVATAGSLPTNCQLATVWRDRLVLAAPRTAPQNFFFSRVGTHTDFDYSQTDSAAAFAGNASTAGHIGEPISALIPATDDVLYIGGDHNLWAVRGDPADNGSIDLVSDAIGVFGPNAWCKAPDGTIYFVSPGGFYHIPAGSGVPILLSDENSPIFTALDRANTFVNCVWDRDRQLCYIFLTPSVAGTATHLAYDARTKGFWPVSYPVDHGPVSVCAYEGDLSTTRMLLLGGRTGYIQAISPTVLNDDGTAISSYIYLGPYIGSDVAESVMEWADVIVAEPSAGLVSTDYNLTAAIQAGQTVEQAFANPRYTRTKVYTTARRQTKWLQRIRSAVFFLKLSNATLNKTWSFEKAIAMFTGSGMVRRR